MADDRFNPKNWLGPYSDGETGWVALRAAERPAYLASALAEFLEPRAWTPEQLAQWLRCGPGELAKLGLCRRPVPSSPEFRDQVAQIVTQFQLDYWNLYRLLEDLSLPGEQRQQLRQTQDFTGHALPPPATTMRSSGHPSRLHKATPPEVSPEWGQAAAAGEQGSSSQAESPLDELAEVRRRAPILASGPAARQSWLGKLWSSIRNFFSRK